MSPTTVIPDFPFMQVKCLITQYISKSVNLLMNLCFTNASTMHTILNGTADYSLTWVSLTRPNTIHDYD